MIEKSSGVKNAFDNSNDRILRRKTGKTKNVLFLNNFSHFDILCFKHALVVRNKEQGKSREITRTCLKHEMIEWQNDGKT